MAFLVVTAMSDELILKLLEEIITEVDYDVAKDIFGKDVEDPEMAEETRERLVRIVKKYSL